MIRPLVLCSAPGDPEHFRWPSQLRGCSGAVLHRRATRVRPGLQIDTLLDDMIATMRVATGGVGLAAPQIGVPYRVVVAEVEGVGLFELLNPELVDARTSALLDPQWESCLSCPDVLVVVPSPLRVTVKALDRRGHEVRLTTDSPLFARVLRHEVDHCNGILLTQRATSQVYSLAEVLARRGEQAAPEAPATVTEDAQVVASAS